jgi:hypothetical protein
MAFTDRPIKVHCDLPMVEKLSKLTLDRLRTVEDLLYRQNLMKSERPKLEAERDLLSKLHIELSEAGT